MKTAIPFSIEQWKSLQHHIVSAFPYVTITEGQAQTYPYGQFEWFIAAAKTAITSWDKLPEHPDYLFGYLGYDIKNQLENLCSGNSQLIAFPECMVFEPEFLVGYANQELTVLIGELPVFKVTTCQFSTPNFGKPNPLTNEVNYQKNVDVIRDYIQQGEVYELNYCIGFRTKVQDFESPLDFWHFQSARNPMPFAAFVKCQHLNILSHSPERFLRRDGISLLSQPIKGTAKRNLEDKQADDLAAKALQTSIKERAENVMIVDLVRNDLARCSKLGTIKVPELFGIYSFKTVHQMISTISSELEPNTSFKDILKVTFPMGSMTGAPKIRAMQLIDTLENFQRGPFSGTIGYCLPNQKADWNVVIRSLFYNSESKELCWYAGGAITWDSHPAEEWAEVCLKTEAIVSALAAYGHILTETE
jgi:para-aminobenzoate synthetase component 1